MVCPVQSIIPHKIAKEKEGVLNKWDRSEDDEIKDLGLCLGGQGKNGGITVGSLEGALLLLKRALWD